MHVLPRTRLGRLSLIAAVALTVAGAAVSAFLLRRAEERPDLEQLRSRGVKAFAEQNYEKAVGALGRYIQYRRRDAESLYRFAQARQRVPEPEQKHLLAAGAVLRYLLTIEPKHEAARRRLLELTLRIGFDSQALQVARELLERHPGDPEGLRGEARALTRLGRFDEALGPSKQYNRKRPRDLDGHLRTMTLLERTGASDKALIGRAEKLLEKHPDDPRFRLLLAITHSVLGRRDAALEQLRRAVEAPEPAPGFLDPATDLFDKLGRYEEAQELLERVADAHPEPGVIRLLVRRHWARGHWQRAVETAGRLAPAARAKKPEVRALHALALVQMGTREKARGIIDELAQGDVRARRWARIARADTRLGGTDPDRLIRACELGLLEDPKHPVLLFFLAEARRWQGRHQTAIHAWRRAAREEPAWALPLLRATRSLAAQERHSEARRLAREALRRSPESVAAARRLAETWYAAYRAGTAEDAGSLLSLVEQLTAQGAGAGRVAVIRVDLLATLKDESAARRALDELLEKDLAGSLLLDLTRVSRRHELGREGACLDRYEELHGVGPGLTFARAIRAGRREGAEAGRERFRQLRERASSGDTRAWKLARARTLSSVGAREEAIEAWRALVEAHPGDARVLRRALEAEAIWGNAELVDRVIERLRSRTGDRSPRWRLARARWILTEKRGAGPARDAVDLLREVLRVSPDRFRARVLMARALRRTGSESEALDHLSTAAKLRPDALDVRLRVAELAQRLGHTARARSVAEAAADHPKARERQRRRAALLLYRQGDTSEAIHILRDIHGGDEAPADLMLARMHRRRGDHERVARIVSKLLEAPNPERIAFAADFYASRGKTERARRVLERLGELDLAPSERAILEGRYFAQRGRRDKARARFRAATESAPESVRAWRTRILELARHGHAERAEVVATEALEAIAASDALSGLRDDPGLIRIAGKRPMARALAGPLLSADPRRRRAASEALRRLRDSENASGGDTRRAIKRLADERPDLLGLQTLAARLYLRAERPGMAASIAERTLRRFPYSAAPAWLAARAHAQAGHWTEALITARQWRQRTQGQPIAADLLISQARIELGEPRRALERTERYVAKAKERPEKHFRLLVRRARALLALGRAAEARDLLSPRLARGSRWRRAWLELAMLAVDDRNRRARWLERLQESIPAEAPTERADLAHAWLELARGEDAPEKWQRRARRLLGRIAGRADASARTLALYGMALERAGRPQRAESAYRRAIERDPEHAIALNNLAMILSREYGRLKQALDLAQRAVEAAPRSPAVLDTLAYVQANMGRHDAAAATMRRAVATGRKAARWRVRLASILASGGKTQEAQKALDSLLRRHDPSELAPRLRRRVEALRAGLAPRAATRPSVPDPWGKPAAPEMAKPAADGG